MGKSKILILIFLTISINLFAQKELRIPNCLPDARFIAIVSNDIWLGDAVLSFGNNDSVMFYFSPDRYYHHIAVKVKFEGLGEYQLPDSAAVLVKTVVGDVLNGLYYSNGIPENRIIITDKNDESGFVKGKFHLVLKNCCDSEIKISSSHFKASYLNMEPN